MLVFDVVVIVGNVHAEEHHIGGVFVPYVAKQAQGQIGAGGSPAEVRNIDLHLWMLCAGDLFKLLRECKFGAGMISVDKRIAQNDNV